MIVDVQASCDIGCVRANNEDLILVDQDLIRDRSYEASVQIDGPTQRLLVAVADGMGGAAAGEWASAYALERLRSFLANAPADLDLDESMQLLDIWASETHGELLNEGTREPARSGAGTTVVGLMLHARGAIRFHAGDSRLYLYRDGTLTRLTQDHSMRQVSGDTTVASNLLLNSLGGAQRSWLECAALDCGLKDFDRFLLSSDGLHDLLDDTDIAAALAAGRSSAVSTLVRMAREAGGKDNISVVVADLGRIAQPATSAAA